jgi:hypothetical protein
MFLKLWDIIFWKLITFKLPKKILNKLYIFKFKSLKWKKILFHIKINNFQDQSLLKRSYKWWPKLGFGKTNFNFNIIKSIWKSNQFPQPKIHSNIKQKDFQNSLWSTIFGPPLCTFTQLWENYYEMEENISNSNDHKLFVAFAEWIYM